MVVKSCDGKAALSSLAIASALSCGHQSKVLHLLHDLGISYLAGRIVQNDIAAIRSEALRARGTNAAAVMVVSISLGQADTNTYLAPVTRARRPSTRLSTLFSERVVIFVALFCYGLDVGW